MPCTRNRYQWSKRRGRARIFAAGHSLGGGLAQHAGYFGVAKKDRLPPTAARRTYLVYENDEVLALLRAGPGYLDRFRRLNTVVVRYNFTSVLDSPSPFRQHGMQRLVAGLLGAP
ncbi:MAG: hypothetical protein M3Y54_03350 [Bacteroidota bacterium]|nr:hypothetical protein [Bacteroidota bacterium]